MAHMVKNLPALQETLVRSLSWEDPLEKGMVTHSSNFAWRIPWTEVPGDLQSVELQRVRHIGATDLPHRITSRSVVTCRNAMLNIHVT